MSALLFTALLTALTIFIMRPYFDRYLSILETNAKNNSHSNVNQDSNEKVHTSEALTKSNPGPPPNNNDTPDDETTPKLSRQDPRNNPVFAAFGITDQNIILPHPEPFLPPTESTSNVQPPTVHGHTYAQMIKSAKPEYHQKLITVDISTHATHVPLILATPTGLHHWTNQSHSSMNAITSPPLISPVIYVLCCSQHRNMVNSAYPNSVVTFIETTNSEILIPTEPGKSNESKSTRQNDKSHREHSKPVSLMDLLNAKDKQKIDPDNSSNNIDDASSTKSSSGVKPTPPNVPSKPAKSTKSTPDFQSTLPYAKRNQSYLTRSPSTSGHASKDDTASSPSKWSDEVEEEEIESTITNKVEYALKTAITSSLIIEFMLILQRAISSPSPRKAIRGIIDTTRRTQPDSAFPLTLGKTAIPLYKVVNHRHSMNHIVTSDSGPAPYLNPGMPVCTAPHCLLNLWPQIPTTLNECRQSSVPDKIQRRLERELKQALTLTEDVEHLKTLRDHLLTAHRTDFDHVTNACNGTLASYKPASVMDLVNLASSDHSAKHDKHSPSIDSALPKTALPT